MTIFSVMVMLTKKCFLSWAYANQEMFIYHKVMWTNQSCFIHLLWWQFCYHGDDDGELFGGEATATSAYSIGKPIPIQVASYPSHSFFDVWIFVCCSRDLVPSSWPLSFSRFGFPRITIQKQAGKLRSLKETRVSCCNIEHDNPIGKNMSNKEVVL